jgi:RNA polymerase sigma-70 factor (ECF subfamily)
MPPFSFTKAWSALGRGARGTPGAFDVALGGLFAAGQAAWPEAALQPDAFIAHLGHVLPAQVDSPEELQVLSGEGLYIAAAVSSGVAGAAEAFEAGLFAPLRRTLDKMDGGSAFADELLQLLRVRLFVERALLLTYAGRGAIGPWLKVVVVRDAQRLRQKLGGDRISARELERLPSPEADPELRFLKLQYRQDFKDAFARALEGLDARQRSVLKMSFVEGLSIDEVGKVYDIHRATAARWIASAREQLVDETRKQLAERLGLQKSELNSLMGLVRSNLSISLSAGLKE